MALCSLYGLFPLFGPRSPLSPLQLFAISIRPSDPFMALCSLYCSLFPLRLSILSIAFSTALCLLYSPYALNGPLSSHRHSVSSIALCPSMVLRPLYGPLLTL